MIKPIIVIGLAATSALVAPAYAQKTARGTFDPLNYSGLRGQTIPVVTTPSGIGGLIKVASPTVMRTNCRMTAKVIEDRPGALVVEVSYSGMPTNVRKLTAMVADAAGTKAVAGVGAASASVSVGEPDATLTFTIPLAADATEGALESKRLFVYGMGGQAHILAVNQMFDCNKKWYRQPGILVAEPLTTLPAPPADPSAPVKLNFAFIKAIQMAQMTMISPTAGRPKMILMKSQFTRNGRSVASRAPDKTLMFASATQVHKTTNMMPIIRPQPAILEASAAKSQPMRLAFRPELITKLKVIDPKVFEKPSQEVQSDQGLGPSGANGISFADRIDADPQYGEVERTLTISPTIYGDKNPVSGLFYYLPARYVLDFATDTGFLLQMFYAAGADGAAGEVNVTAFLRASVNPTDLQIGETFIKEFMKTQNRPFKRLAPFFGTPQASLEAAIATQLFIPQEKVKVLGVGDGVVNVSLSMTPDKAELFLSFLTRSTGLSGQMSYTSTADPTLTVGVPMELRLPDRNSLRLNMTPQNTFKNDSPFPVALKYIHVLRFTSGTPTVYTFNLPDNEIAPSAQVTIDRSKIPDWLTAAPSKLWADFMVIPDAASIEKALRGITQASSGAAAAQVTVEKVGDFPAGVTAVTVVVTSKYFTPFGAREETKEVTLTPADTTMTLGPIFSNGRQEGVDLGADKPYVKWSLKVIKNGMTLKTPLVPSNRLTISVGAEQIGAAR